MLNYTEAARFGQNPSFELRASGYELRPNTNRVLEVRCSKLEARSDSPGSARDADDACHVMLIIDPTSGKVL